MSEMWSFYQSLIESISYIILPHTQVDDEANLEVRSYTEMGDRQMAALFPALLSAFRSGVDEVALPLMPFMHAYTARLKVQHKR